MKDIGKTVFQFYSIVKLSLFAVTICFMTNIIYLKVLLVMCVAKFCHISVKQKKKKIAVNN